MTDPIVSVIMPSFNSEKHIAESIQSIIDQSFMDWELIIVDGHSKDNTISIIEGFMSGDSRIKMIYDEGEGIGPALNLGCRLAKGKYIARMDSDDVSYKNRLEKQVRYLEKHNDVVLLSCLAEYMNESGQFLGYGFSYTSTKLINKNLSSIFHPGVLMLRKTCIMAGGYPPLKRAEDLFLWYRMRKYGKIKVLRRPLIKYRVSDTALSSSMSDFFKKKSVLLWDVISCKKTVTNEDYNYLNYFISENIIKQPFRENPARRSENRLFSFFSYIMPKNMAFRIVLFIKNVYGSLFMK